jgi:dihydrofolate reductase
MRKVIYAMSVSLDGFTETPDRKIDWVIVDEELHTFFNAQAREQDAFLYGRRMYELMARDWPTVDANPSNPAYMVEFSRIWKDTPKVVFSKTLREVAWNSRLVRDNIAGEVAKLKAQPGKDLGVGGPTLAASFMQLGDACDSSNALSSCARGRASSAPVIDAESTLYLLATASVKGRDSPR